jgi:virulence-associated protein VagC
MIHTGNGIDHNKRIIRVSGKRQITIPLKYFLSLGLSDQVECSLEDGALVIRPLTQDENEFSVEILKDLVAQGFTGDELIQKFTETSQQIKKAVRSMVEEADGIAAGQRHFAGMADVFGEDGDV